MEPVVLVERDFERGLPSSVGVVSVGNAISSALCVGGRGGGIVGILKRSTDVFFSYVGLLSYKQVYWIEILLLKKYIYMNEI